MTAETNTHGQPKEFLAAKKLERQTLFNNGEVVEAFLCKRIRGLSRVADDEEVKRSDLPTKRRMMRSAVKMNSPLGVAWFLMMVNKASSCNNIPKKRDKVG